MQQRGFTLIELIIVIVILGVLAVTAAPRFIDLQGDARASTLDGAKAAMRGGAQLVYAKAAIAGAESNEDTTVLVNGESVPAAYGYPKAEDMTPALLAAWLDMNLSESSANDDSTDWEFVIGADGETETSPTEGAFALMPNGVSYNSDTSLACQVVYTNASGPNDRPSITVQSDGC